MKDNQENQWFSHNRMAASEPNMKKLLKKYGSMGYGRWWMLVEILRGMPEYKLKLSTDKDYKDIIQDLYINKTDTARTYIDDCLQFGLLQTDGEYIWSEDLRKRMEKMDRNRASYSLRGKKSAALMQERRQQQLDKSVTEEATELQQNSTQYNTQHNNTLQDNTMMLEEQPTETTKNDNDMYKVKQLKPYLDTLADHSITDQLYFAHPVCTAHGIGMDKLRDWLQAFNRHLTFLGDTQKSERDYRSHFVHWLKFQDVKGDATAYKPLPDAVAKPQPAAATPGKSYDEILQARQREVDGM